MSNNEPDDESADPQQESKQRGGSIENGKLYSPNDDYIATPVGDYLRRQIRIPHLPGNQ